MKFTTTNSKGFTLIETLVVVTIMVSLTSLAMHLYHRSISLANKAASTNNLRQLCLANLSYAADQGTFAPAQDKKNLKRWHGARTSSHSRFDPTKGFLADYLGKSRRVTTCPGFTELIDDSSSWELGSGGYGYNSTYIGGTPSDSFKPNRPSNIEVPTRTIMFATTAFAKSKGLQEYPYVEPYKWVDPNWKLRGRLQPSIHFRFNQTALIAWCDGSITAEKSIVHGRLNYYGGNNKEAAIGFIGPKRNNGYFSSRKRIAN